MSDNLANAIKRASDYQLGLQANEGYWWYTLEATEYISAEAIFLSYFMGEPDRKTESGLARRILSRQRKDGTWALYYGGPPDLSTTIECYWALKLVQKNLPFDVQDSLNRARDFILTTGGITCSRVFTKIHLAMFGLVPWSACPAMPIEFILMPTWAPVNVYEFSSWARACIIPLLVIMQKKEVRCLPDNFSLDELFAEPPQERDWNFKTNKFFLSWEKFFIQLNKILRAVKKLPIPSPFEDPALKRCEDWICEHIAKTEDIYPALAYGAMALSVLGHPNSHPTIRKALNALRNFQQVYDDGVVHQQCCISPVWDTPWQMTALLDAGVPNNHPQLLKAGRWLLSKQITKTYGDWRIKNPDTLPGGWSFEFENEFFPDIDDTVQVLHVLNRLALPPSEKNDAVKRGLDWVVSMQNDDGGWGAFDKNQTLDVVNKIPFSDHGACLDPSSPDITARVMALLSDVDYERFQGLIQRGLKYLEQTQEEFGGWTGRWGINYIYGTWCVLTTISKLPPNPKWGDRIFKAVNWLKSIQNSDGGFSESPDTYVQGRYLPYPGSPGVPSQTAWALLGLIAAGEGASGEVKRGLDFLINRLNDDGTWDEEEFTGTGFPGHFYIRYHGYRHFFPLLALAKAKLSGV